MLMVKASKGPSDIHGVGLIAREAIPRGTTVWRFQPGFDLALPAGMLALLSPTAREQVRYYAYLDATAQVYFLSSDDDRFTNHSDTANTADKGYLQTVATRDIAAGEEVTWDYGPWRTADQQDRLGPPQ